MSSYAVDVSVLVNLDPDSLIDRLGNASSNVIVTRCAISTIQHIIETALEELHEKLDKRIELTRRVINVYKSVGRHRPWRLSEALEWFINVTQNVDTRLNFLFRFLKTYRRYACYDKYLEILFEQIGEKVYPHNLLSRIISAIPKERVQDVASRWSELVKRLYIEKRANFVEGLSLRDACELVQRQRLCVGVDPEDCAQFLAIDLANNLQDDRIIFVTHARDMSEVLSIYRDDFYRIYHRPSRITGAIKLT